MAESKKRRARGEGSIRQRKDGTWEARFVVGIDPGTGKDIRKSVYAKTQKEVRKKMTEAIAALDKDDYREPCKMTLDQWLDIWSKEYLGSVKPRTVADYKDNIKNHIKPALGAIKLDALTAHAIQKFYNSLAKPASDGGKKKFYRGIYTAMINTDTVLAWRKVGELPVASAYGVSVSCPDGIICIGGTDGKDALTSVYKISWGRNPKAAKQGKVVIETLPALPYALDNMCGTLIGGQLFVAGGNRNGKPSNSFLCLDLDRLETGWQELPDFPGDARTASKGLSFSSSRMVQIQ